MRYKCTGCGKLLQRKCDCPKHIRKCKFTKINAQPEKIDVKEIEAGASLRCQISPVFFPKKQLLIKHIDFAHNGISYAQPEKIKIDVIEIEAGTSLQCQICSMFFRQKHLLIAHIDFAHNGIRYKCTACGRLRQRKCDCLTHIKK